MSQYFAVIAKDKPGMLTTRERIRPHHRAYLQTGHEYGVHVHLGGPTMSPNSSDMNGTLLVIEANSLSDVELFLGNDPYMHADLFEHVEIRPWNWSLGNPAQRS